MNNPEIVKVGRARHDLRKLEVLKNKVGTREGIASGLTNRKRFAFGLVLVYLITSPFCIQSEMIRKPRGSVEIETPNKGRMLG